MAVSVNQILANTLGLADPLGRIADDGRVGFNGRVNINGRPIRFAPNFDGVDDYGVFANRAINPDGDNTFEFWTPSDFSVERAIISQTISSNSALMEFRLFSRTTPDLTITFGGAPTIFFTSAQGLKPSTRYGLTLIGNSLQVFEGGLGGTLVRSTTFTRGTAREPAALTNVCARNNNGSMANFFIGRQYNIRINGTLWRMADRNQAIQLPEPSGLGAELITPTVLENPAVKGSQWTYLGAGRWQYVGDGTLNELQFILSGAQPSSGFVEFEVESYSGAGSMTCSITAAGNPVNSLFNSVGVKRYFFTDKGVSNANTFVFKRASGSASCIIKNISFKPLGTCNPMTLVNVTSDRWQEVPQ